MSKPPLLFTPEDLPEVSAPAEANFRSLTHPVWSEDKARLIQEYIKLFTLVTKHGTYLDGFAAPQRRDMANICSAKLVLDAQPAWLRDFCLCDIDPEGTRMLEEIAAPQRSNKRRIMILTGDFNDLVQKALDGGRIKSKTATFALLDQRTFECHWSTVQEIADYKRRLDPACNKVEIFYFLASGWLDRSIAAVSLPKTKEKLDRWWGNSTWKSLQGMQGIPRARLLAGRFEKELGYKYVRFFAIHSQKRRGRIMYHMIHATDNEHASPLMLRAYRRISGRTDIDPLDQQIDMDALWREAEEGA